MLHLTWFSLANMGVKNPLLIFLFFLLLFFLRSISFKPFWQWKVCFLDGYGLIFKTSKTLVNEKIHSETYIIISIIFNSSLAFQTWFLQLRFRVAETSLYLSLIYTFHVFNLRKLELHDSKIFEFHSNELKTTPFLWWKYLWRTSLVTPQYAYSELILNYSFVIYVD